MPTPAVCRSAGRISTLSCALSDPTMLTWATPGMARSSAPIVWSASDVISGAVSVVEVMASETIGSVFGSKRWMIGSRISGGSWPRTSEIASRTSCVAWLTSFEKANWTMIWAKPSVELELILSTPLMPESRSSMRVTTSRSTISGAAPGYATATNTIG